MAFFFRHVSSYRTTTYCSRRVRRNLLTILGFRLRYIHIYRCRGYYIRAENDLRPRDRPKVHHRREATDRFHFEFSTSPRIRRFFNGAQKRGEFSPETFSIREISIVLFNGNAAPSDKFIFCRWYDGGGGGPLAPAKRRIKLEKFY